MTKNFEKDFYDDAISFLEKLLSEASCDGLDLKQSIDHLCYRVETGERYDELKRKLSSFGACLVESMVGGRPIATYKLNRPIFYKDYIVDLIELPAPKTKSFYAEGFEHAEFISKTPLEFRNRKPFNSEKKVKFLTTCMKWHYQSLESVINLEKNENVYQALLESKLLENLEDFDPLVAGTFPLHLHHSQSDIDLLVGCDDLRKMFDCAHQSCLHFDLFEAKLEERYFTINFTFQNVAFEIYGEQRPSVSQNAFVHFQIQEKLLKVGSSIFREKIVERRKLGDKTEPAFANVLELEGDPYVSLLELSHLTDFESYHFLKKINSDFVL